MPGLQGLLAVGPPYRLQGPLAATRRTAVRLEIRQALPKACLFCALPSPPAGLCLLMPCITLPALPALPATLTLVNIPMR